MATFGATTKRSLAGAGQFLFMGLNGVVLASLVGVFWHSDGLQFVISLVGVVVFAWKLVYRHDRKSLVTFPPVHGSPCLSPPLLRSNHVLLRVYDADDWQVSATVLSPTR
jgi:hypothetical protein